MKTTGSLLWQFIISTCSVLTFFFSLPNSVVICLVLGLIVTGLVIMGHFCFKKYFNTYELFFSSLPPTPTRFLYAFANASFRGSVKLWCFNIPEGKNDHLIAFPSGEEVICFLKSLLLNFFLKLFFCIISCSVIVSETAR